MSKPLIVSLALVPQEEPSQMVVASTPLKVMEADHRVPVEALQAAFLVVCSSSLEGVYQMAHLPPCEQNDQHIPQKHANHSGFSSHDEIRLISSILTLVLVFC